MTLDFEIAGWALPTQINQSAHFMARSRAVAKQRATMALAWMAHVGRKNPGRPPYDVTLVRVGPRRVDSDNVVSAFKHCRDEIARQLEVDDGDQDLIRFQYGQERGDFAVRVKVECRPRRSR